ncbi:major facilitator superfamily domain-containing protein [Camillea tinctor]|nr:major facilitator superfamily domain-containing protein [Camillea tinctor]
MAGPTAQSVPVPARDGPDAEKHGDIIAGTSGEVGSSSNHEENTDSDIDAAEARRITRKIDWRIIPLLQFLYMLTFLDRVNIGNARLWHLERDLGMEGYDYNIAVLVFYIPYIILEIPSQYVFNRVEPRKFIGVIIMGWGLSVLLSGLSRTKTHLIASRVVLGIFEAGMFPSCMYLISGWYRRHQLVSRVAFFFVANDVAGTVSGLLGAGLGALGDDSSDSSGGIGGAGGRGIAGWRWIFFVEGALTCVSAVAAWFWVPPFPGGGGGRREGKGPGFLTPRERTWLLRQLERDNRGMRHERMTLEAVGHALRDWKVLTSGILYLGVCTTAYSLSVFQPTILATFGWGSLKSNLLSAPPRVASALVSVAMGLWSDQVRRRGPFVLAGFTLSIVGLLLVVLLRGTAPRYAGVYCAAIGIYVCQPMAISWCINQVTSSTKRGVVTAYAGSVGQLGGIISALVFPSKDGPQYVNGIVVCIVLQLAAIAAAVNMWVCCAWENRQRQLGKKDYLRELSEEEQVKLGELHPDFRYTL